MVWNFWIEVGYAALLFVIAFTLGYMSSWLRVTKEADEERLRYTKMAQTTRRILVYRSQEIGRLKIRVSELEAKEGP